MHRSCERDDGAGLVLSGHLVVVLGLTDVSLPVRRLLGLPLIDAAEPEAVFVGATAEGRDAVSGVRPVRFRAQKSRMHGALFGQERDET
jgi:hypothetical protein